MSEPVPLSVALQEALNSLNMFQTIRYTAWVDADGSYGVGPIILSHQDSLTPEQWETMSILSDNDRFDYVSAISQGKSVAEWEEPQ